MTKLGGKGREAMMMMATSSPSKVGDHYFRRGNLPVFHLSRLCSSYNEVVSEKKSRGGAEDPKARIVGDIQVYSRVTSEMLEFGDQKKKSWWMPHPVTGVFSPYERESLDAIIEKEETTPKSSAGVLGEIDT